MKTKKTFHKAQTKRKKTVREYQRIASAMEKVGSGTGIPFTEEGRYKLNNRKPKNKRGVNTRLIIGQRVWSMKKTAFITVRHLSTLFRGTADGMNHVIR